MANNGLVGSLDVPAPKSQTFGNLHVWTQLWAQYGDLIDNAEKKAKVWWDAGQLFQAYHDALDDIDTHLRGIASELAISMSGSAVSELVSRIDEIRKHVEDHAQRTEYYLKAVDSTGHDIIVFRESLNEAVAYFHRLTEKEEDAIEKKIRDIGARAKLNSDEIEELVRKGRDAAYQMVEQNHMMPHMRALLVILATKYADKQQHLKPLNIRVSNLGHIEGSFNGSGSGSGSGGGNSGSGTGTGDGLGLGSGDGTGTGEGTGLGAGPGAGEGAGSGAGSGSGVPDDLGASVPGFGSAGGGSGSGGLGSSGLGSGGSGSDYGSSGSGSSTGSGSERDDALEDARQAANDAIEALKSPTDSPERTEALEEAQKAIDDAINGLKGGSGDAVDALKEARDAANDAIDGLGSGTGYTSGSGYGSGTKRLSPTSSDSDEREQALQDARDAINDAIDGLIDQTESGSGAGGGPGTGSEVPTVTDPDAQERVEALEDAREAVEGAIQDLIDENEASDADPHTKQVREDALRDAQDAAVDAIDDLIDTAGGDATTDDEVRADALTGAHEAVDEALDELTEDLARDGMDAHEREIRQDALDDARTAVDDVIGDLKAEKPDAGLDTPGETQADALGDAKRELTAEFDRLVSETLDDRSLSDADKLARVDALNDAKNAALRAVDEVVAARTERAETRAELANFLKASTAPSSLPATASTSTGATASTEPTMQLGTTTTASLGQAGTGSADPMRLDASAMPANQGMPMAPPMGGLGAAHPSQRERDRAGWLVGEPGVWADNDDEVAGQAIGRNRSS